MCHQKSNSDECCITVIVKRFLDSLLQSNNTYEAYKQISDNVNVLMSCDVPFIDILQATIRYASSYEIEVIWDIVSFAAQIETQLKMSNKPHFVLEFFFLNIYKKLANT
jgi:transcriptional regulator